MELRDLWGDAAVDDFAVDARKVRPGSAFFAFSGFGVDGHDWVPVALANGAAAVVAERPVEVEVPLRVVPDARVALAEASDAFWGRPSATLPVVGVTGTSGKTTTAHLIFSILAAAGGRPGMYGTLGVNLGTRLLPPVPWSPMVFHLHRTYREMLDAGNRSCVFEFTSHDADLRRTDATHFAALVFTNLGHEHLDYHGTMDGYFAAKRRPFFEGRPPAAVNVGDAYGRRLYDELRTQGRENVLSFGLADDADIRAEDVHHSREGTRLRVGAIELHTPLLGAFNVENVLAAVAAARLLRVPDEAIVAGVASLAAVPGRLERIDEGQAFRVYVDFAHKPEALEAVLRTARSLTDGRLICVFGCGGDAYRGKRPLMGRIARTLADHVIVTTDNPRTEDPRAIADEIAAGGTPDEVELDRRRAIERALDTARPGDVVVVAGRGHEPTQLFGDGRAVPFDDRAVVRELLHRSP
jgi:UDP-N-acetylmuramoyl-L-alanyl-D-glutamate--2,6-diaminopimelate ligase